MLASMEKSVLKSDVGKYAFLFFFLLLSPPNFASFFCRAVTQLPDKGLSKNEIISVMRTSSEIDEKHWVKGRASGTVYSGRLLALSFLLVLSNLFCFS
jgi:hypothetical protein